MKYADLVVQRFLEEYDRAKSTAYSKAVTWLDPDKSRAQAERVEAIAYDHAKGWLAVEHTLIQPFEGEQDRIRGPLGHVFEPLEHDPALAVPEHYLLVGAHIDAAGAVPKGAKTWGQAHSAVRTWFLNAKDAFPIGCSDHTIPIPGSKVQLSVTVQNQEIRGYPGKVHVIYGGRPDTFPDVVRGALERKLGKLAKASADKQSEGQPCRGGLLLEQNRRDGGNFFDVQRFVREHRTEFPDLEKIDEVWVADTFDSWEYLQIWPNVDDIVDWLPRSS